MDLFYNKLTQGDADKPIFTQLYLSQSGNSYGLRIYALLLLINLNLYF